MYIEKQKFFVLGLSKSGVSAARFLLSKRAVVYVYDDHSSEKIARSIHELTGLGAKTLTKEEVSSMPDVCDALVLSPGIPIDYPLAVAFKRKGKAVVGETELAARFMRCVSVAVTGTNGKTTTVSMLEKILQQGGVSAHACGNIGAPMIDYCGLSETEVAVAEISSFQLETLQSFCPHVAVVLNITEDHLNRHYNMDNYVYLKSKLLRNSTGTEYAVLNYDDPIVRAFAEKTKARVLYFSMHERVVGAFYENDALWFGKERIMPVDDLPLAGVHNVQNALASIAVAKIMGVKTADIVKALTEFKGVKHRIDQVGTFGGITFIDDSKATNVDATLKAVSAMNADTVLLLGGKNKGYDYDDLFSALRKTRVVHAVLYGENRYSLLKSAQENGFSSVSVCDGFDFAVHVAILRAEQGQTVLLSPASASFDEFSNYEERGDRFVEIVGALAENADESKANYVDDGKDGSAQFNGRMEETE
ncbi:MAG: UDP-N-acetylmuramoyl-L-alanine--D-glutamate ligase [Clostridia bacterium]|nr:UDP-N-acetylmuramoyl-L-alanine--D-glutamate ligase [Clostridia bacterium]